MGNMNVAEGNPTDDRKAFALAHVSGKLSMIPYAVPYGSAVLH